MRDPDIEFSKWKQERKKGSVRFVISISLPGILGVMVGRSIHLLFFSEAAWDWIQTVDILISGFWAAVGAIPFSFVIWWWREKKYHRHIVSLKKRT
ncbi:hypothetical protein [Vibrio diabolicus]|uniref:hypothetical protein n=1 Tax=Vibrio diabolicus TaxID=50719 RepID=UPI003750A131